VDKTGLTRVVAGGLIFISATLVPGTLGHAAAARKDPRLDAQQWVEQKVNDPLTGSELKELAAAVEKECDVFTASDSTYDPVPCWQGQERALVALSKLAGTDPSSNSKIRADLANDLRGVRHLVAEWEGLSLQRKIARRRILAELVMAVNAAGGDTRVGLEALQGKSGAGKEVQRAAKRALVIFGGKCRWGCICVTGKGCLCCGYDAIVRASLSRSA